MMATGFLTALHIFDFDGTLAFTPDHVEGRELYRQREGREWPYIGWWGRVESLSHPSVIPYPAPASMLNNSVMSALKEVVNATPSAASCNFAPGSRALLPNLVFTSNPVGLAYVMTGRRQKLKQAVVRVLRDLGVDEEMVPEERILCNDSRYDTLTFKLEKARELMDQVLMQSMISRGNEIHFWEDRLPHAKAFADFDPGNGFDVIVHYVQGEDVVILDKQKRHQQSW